MPTLISLFTNPLPSFPLRTHHPIFLSSKHKHLRFPSVQPLALSMSIASSTIPEDEIAQDFSPFLRIRKNGIIERLLGIEIVPPGLDPDTHVQSKDVIISQESNLSARLFLPKNTNRKLPVLVYYHGGGFCIETPFSPPYHNHLNNIASEANVVAISVDYRRAPEHPLPIGYDDSWAALKWAASHVNGNGPEEWLNNYVDLEKVFLSGDSAGANIAHQMGIRNGKDKIVGINLVGIILAHPYFWGKEPIGNEGKEKEKRAVADAIWHFACPKTSGCDDPWINPIVDPDLSRIGCSKILVIVAEKDVLKDRGWQYYQKLRENGWKGSVEIMENKEVDHVFHLHNTTCENALAVVKKMVSFINE